MRKPQFYAKLAAGNLWRNRTSYLPFLLAAATSVFTLYSLWAIFYGGALTGLPYAVYVEGFTLAGSFITAIFCSILLFWTNSYLIKRRKKELALYSVLGMEKRNIGIVMLFETFFIGIVALAVGILAGLLLTRLLFAALMRLMGEAPDVTLSFSPFAVGLTIAFFGCVFLLILLRNLRQVRAATPSKMLAGAKEGEREPRASWLVTLIGLASLGAGYYLAFTVENPVSALLYFLLAALLVIIGTYCLFTSGSIVVLKLMRRNKGFYYTPRHFISVSGMIYRMKQNAAGLASICILSCMVLVTLSSTVSLYVGSDDSLRVQYPYEYRVNMTDQDAAVALEEALRAASRETGAELADYAHYRTWTIPVEQQGASLTTDLQGDAFSLRYMTLADYNAANGTATSLQNGEYLLFYTNGFDYETVKASGNQLELEGQSLQVAGTVDTINRSELDELNASPIVYLVGESIPLAYEGVEPGYVQQFDLAGTDAQKEAFYQHALALRHDAAAQGAYWFFAIRAEMQEEWYQVYGGLLFLGIYFGIMFLLAAVLIIYYKQISEGYEDGERFDILQKVGMSQREVRKTINSQIRMVFYLPLLVAVLHIFVATLLVRRVMVLFGVLNFGLLLAATALTILVYALVYLLVYRRTARTYFRLVRRTV